MGINGKKNGLVSISLNKEPDNYSLAEEGITRFFYLLDEPYYEKMKQGPGQTGYVTLSRHVRTRKSKLVFMTEFKYDIGRLLFGLMNLDKN